MPPSLLELRADAPPAGMPPPGAGGAPPGPPLAGNASDFTLGPTLTPEQLAALPHNSRGPELNVILWVLAGLSGGFLALRLYCKMRRGKGPWWDDWVLLAAWVSLRCREAAPPRRAGAWMEWSVQF